MGLLDIFKKKKTKKRGYEGASKKSRTSGWLSGAGDANASIAIDLATLRNRSRDLRRNNPLAHRAIEVVTNNVIGKGIMTQIDGSDIAINAWKEWAGTKACDFDGQFNLKGLQKLAMDTITESGEVLIRKRIVAGLKYPFQYQILEGDFLSSMETNATQKGHTVVQGIEFDAQGKRFGYHLYEAHPGSMTATMKSNFIPDSEIYHIFRVERPGQVRGVPWSAPVMMRLRDLDGFEDAQLMRQKVAACFTAFVHDISVEADCEDDSDLGERIEPAMIEHLPPGKSVTFANPPSVENYKEFTSSQQRAIAAGYGITYEALTMDLSEVNFSSGRMGWIEMGRNIDSWRQFIIIDSMLTPVTKDFIFMMGLIGQDVSGSIFTHIPPKREMIDPTKEVPAAIEAIRGGLTSRAKVVASMGEDVDAIDKEIKKDNDRADGLGLVLDSDPRKIGLNGKAQDTGEKENENAE